MRKSTITGLVTFVIVSVFGLTVLNDMLVKSQVQYYATSYKQPSISVVAPKPLPKKAASTYKVAYMDSLDIIAAKYNVPWRSIYNKNPAMKAPSDLTTGQEIVIPAPDEVLADRPIPSFQVVSHTDMDEAQVAAQASLAAAKQAVVTTSSAAGNLYAPGNCTWYAKSKRPDLPNNLGNAYTWVTRARAQGLATGTAPRPGAVGQRGNHVVYVEGVNTDGIVAISEMNFAGLYKITRRTLPANYFTYIY